MFSFSKKEKEEVALLVHVGNGSIVCALTSLTILSKPKILYSIRAHFPLSEKPDAARLIHNTNSLLDPLLETLMKNGFTSEYWKKHKKIVDFALVTFSSPWFVSKTKRISILEENPFTVTKAFIENIVQNEEAIFKKELVKEDRRETTETFSIIEKSVLHTKINGYTLDNPIGKKTKRFEAFLFMSLVAETIEKEITSRILKHTHILKNHILLHTFPLITFSAIRDMFPSVPDFLVMDITGEITEITLVRDNTIVETLSFPFGRNSIIRHIAKKLNLSPEIASSTFNMYMAKKTEGAVAEKLENIFIDLEKEWSVYFEDVLVDFSPTLTLPINIYMTVDADIAPVIVDFIKLPKTDVTAVFRKNVHVVHLEDEVFSTLYEGESRLEKNERVSLMALFFKKIQQIN
jgi:hypothetical protein